MKKKNMLTAPVLDDIKGTDNLIGYRGPELSRFTGGAVSGMFIKELSLKYGVVEYVILLELSTGSHVSHTGIISFTYRYSTSAILTGLFSIEAFGDDVKTYSSTSDHSFFKITKGGKKYVAIKKHTSYIIDPVCLISMRTSSSSRFEIAAEPELTGIEAL